MQNGGGEDTFKLYIEHAGPRFGRYKKGIDVPKALSQTLAPEAREEIISLFKLAIRVNRESKKSLQKARAKRAVELFSPPSEEPLQIQQTSPALHSFVLDGAAATTVAPALPEGDMFTGEPPEKLPRQMDGQTPSPFVGCAAQTSVPASVSPACDERQPIAVVSLKEIMGFLNDLRMSQQQ